MNETYEEMTELVDKIQLAHRYNEKKVSFKNQVLSVKDAEALVEQHAKGVKRGSKK